MIFAGIINLLIGVFNIVAMATTSPEYVPIHAILLFINIVVAGACFVMGDY